MRELANRIVESIEHFGIEERCKNYNDSWEATKKAFLKEAERGDGNTYFWQAVKNFAEILENYTC